MFVRVVIVGWFLVILGASIGVGLVIYAPWIVIAIITVCIEILYLVLVLRDDRIRRHW